MKQDKNANKEMSEYSPVLITRANAPDMKVCAMHAFALMHHPDALDGDMEINYYNEETDTISVTEASDMSFDEFCEALSGMEAFHCRIQLPWKNNIYGLPNRDISLISKHYDFMFDSMLAGELLMLHGGGAWKHDELYRFYENDLKPLVEMLKNGKKLPTKQFVNPAPDKLCCKTKLLTEKADANGKIHVPERSKRDEQLSYYCFRPAFDFNCLEEIPCCGQCPIMYKAYELLITEALDTESADRLRKLIEESGIFAKDCADGTRKCKYSGQCHDECKSEKAEIAREEIRRYWYECYSLV